MLNEEVPASILNRTSWSRDHRKNTYAKERMRREEKGAVWRPKDRSVMLKS